MLAAVANPQHCDKLAKSRKMPVCVLSVWFWRRQLRLSGLRTALGQEEPRSSRASWQGATKSNRRQLRLLAGPFSRYLPVSLTGLEDMVCPEKYRKPISAAPGIRAPSEVLYPVFGITGRTASC